MAAAAGRKIRISFNPGVPVVIAGAQTDSLTINNELIDITDKDALGIKTLLDDIGVTSIALSVEGVTTDDTLAGLARGVGEGTTLNNYDIAIGGLGTYSGAFAITNYADSGVEGATPITFTCSLESSGAIAFV